MKYGKSGGAGASRSGVDHGKVIKGVKKKTGTGNKNVVGSGNDQSGRKMPSARKGKRLFSGS
jgi:hypothetical protein